ncbi:MAG TPA: sensor domain-containing protein [Actinomycetes bacterium]|nr:sensor domain-containing protein [Actinomycetes bacterium]
MTTTVPATRPSRANQHRVPFLLMPFHPRTWLETLYVLLSFPIATAGFVFAVITLSTGVALIITLIGIPIIGLAIVGGRAFGMLDRARAARLLGEHTPPPFPLRAARPGIWAWIKAALTDRPGWRALSYLVLLFPWTVFTFALTLTTWTWALSGLTYPIWYRWSEMDPGVEAQVGPWTLTNQDFNSGWALAVAVGLGLVMLFLAPYLVRGFANVERAMVRGLLSGRPMPDRIRDLEASRGTALEASAADLRRIERDLHDTTQARLVALTMDLGQAKEKLADDPERAQILVEKAHDEVKQVLSELRGIARGIHPAVLTDRGLDPALSAVAARSPVPVTVEVDLPPDRPSPAVEAIAYVSACELLANIARHSQASAAMLRLTKSGDLLRLAVSDDGVGGADPAAGTGLAGLAERVATVDGRLTVLSPAGGPTVVTVELPWTR